jgi:ADP-ribosylation factor-like protein 6
VIDATDKLRIKVAKNELDNLMDHSSIKKRGVPILFFANKMDLGIAMNEQEVAKEMQLYDITDRAWHI